jgi:Bacterial Ig-like domain (group 3)
LQVPHYSFHLTGRTDSDSPGAARRRGPAALSIARRPLLALVTALGLTLGFAATALATPVAGTPGPAITPAGPVGEGTALTVTPGTWTSSSTGTITTADEWSDCTPANVCTTSSGSTYTVPGNEPAHSISVTETATDSSDSTTATATSNVVTVHEPPANSVAPSISGTTAAQGQALTVTSPGTWSNSPSFTYVWEDCSGGTCNPSATSTNSTSYTVTAADAAGGYGIRVAVTGTNADGFATANSPTTSAATGVPANTAVPTITGTAAGGTLTEVHGTWTNTPTSYTYQWLSCTGASASTCTSISGATAQTYAVPAANDGLGYEVQETASNISGAGAPATSAVLIPPPPANTVLPAISGTVAVGQTLTASTGTWSNGPTAYAYQWQRCSGSPLSCSAISGATGASYVLTSSDAGFTTEVQVTATNAGGSASISSAGSALPSPPSLRAAPFITGTAQQGQTLTDNAALWQNNPTLITRQWYLCDSSTNNCVAIAAATAQTYVPTATNVGGTIQVSETASNAGGSSTTYSQFVGPVTNPQTRIPAPTNSSPPGISGPTQQGATLVESHGAWTGNPGTFSYQWLRCRAGTCTSVAGATSQTYTLGPGDVGFTLETQESASNAGGTGDAATSADTGVVTATSSTALVAPARAVTDQSLILIATVTSGSGNAPAAGAVSFRTSTGAIAGCSAVAAKSTGQTATATCQTSFVTGTVAATAAFSPASGSLVAASTSPASTIVVGKAATVVHLASPADVAVRAKVKYTVTVTPKSSASKPMAPAGKVTFMDHGKAIRGCSGSKLVKASASCQVKYGALGKHRITVRYGGNAYFSPATSAVGNVSVGKQGPNYVTTVMQWYVHYSPTDTRFTSWQAYGTVPGSSFYFTCSGKGCPFATHLLTVANSSSCKAKGKGKTCPGSNQTVNLEPVFGNAKLHAGTKITVSILRCGWYGKHYTITIRPGRGPSSVITNLPLGVTRPGLKC